MAIDFSNTNTLWASILAETLQRLGLRLAVICPGSRSGPLAIAFAQQEQIEAIPILDERSAAFFALGQARRTGLPVGLICTSGTAAANFYPAVIEARESQVPLLLLTADRPPELRHCHAGQAIDQVKLYGHYPNWQAELALPSLEPTLLAYLRQTLVYAWERSRWPVPGPVHLNLPFREPLAPIPEAAAQAQAKSLAIAAFFAGIPPLQEQETPAETGGAAPLGARWQQCQRGLIIAGPAQPGDPQAYCQAIARLGQLLGWPVLAEGLSPLRNYADLNPHLVATYDLILRHPQWAIALAPEMVIRLGELPTSKTLRTWLSQIQPQQWVVDPTDQNLDPLHGNTRHLRLCVQTLAQSLTQNPALLSKENACSSAPPYLQKWLTLEQQVRQAIATQMNATDTLVEAKVAWMLSQHLPPSAPLWIANSMPIRDVEWFWQPGNSHVQPYFNRGANGIDGTLSAALGMAHRQPSSVLLTGDLALLHDTNGFLVRSHWVGHLTIVLINNNGGGIFGMLPIAAFEPPFETFFATPQNIDFAKLCATYDLEYELISTWSTLAQRLNPLPKTGIRVLEIPCDRHADAQWRQNHLNQFIKGPGSDGSAQS